MMIRDHGMMIRDHGMMIRDHGMMILATVLFMTYQEWCAGVGPMPDNQQLEW